MKPIHDEISKALGPTLKYKEPLSTYTTLKIGGPAEYFYTSSTVEDLVLAVKTARQLKIPYFILGGGSNVLIADNGFDGLVIKNATHKISIRGMKGKQTQGEVKHKTVYVEADSGVPINQLVRFTVDGGLAGLEAHLGLPGTIGGAIYMNAKWMHPESYVGDCVYQATVLKDDNTVSSVSKSYFRFAYDYSYLQDTHDILLSVIFALHSSEKDLLWEKANASIEYRRNSQPQGVRSAGCTFRNISKPEALEASTPEHTTSAGFLIDHSGLKGAQSGDAVISTQHANFIINNGHAKASDMVELIEKARDEVKRQFGVTLTEEIVRVGV